MDHDIKPGYYRHNRTGKLYKLLCIASDSKSLRPTAVYEALYRNKVSQYWARPVAEFAAEVMPKGEKVPRFSEVARQEGLNAEQKWRRRSVRPKHGTVVFVRSGRYVGHGIVHRKGQDCPTDQVPTLLENGNVWWYPAGHVSEATVTSTCPGWILRKKHLRQIAKP